MCDVGVARPALLVAVGGDREVERALDEAHTILREVLLYLVEEFAAPCRKRPGYDHASVYRAREVTRLGPRPWPLA